VKDRFKEGLRIKLLLVNEGSRGGFTSRGFIEYIPGEYCWRGIDAEGYMVIHCIWVVGKHKKKGYGTKLLQECLKDAEGMHGVTVVASEKNWLPGRKIFLKNGFEKVDEMPSSFELYALRFSSEAPLPRFNQFPEERLEEYNSGISIFRSDQCPYLADAVKHVGNAAEQKGIPVKIVQIENCKQAQKGVHPYGTYCFLLDGEVVSYHYLLEKEVKEILENK
jgi:GNAT superfamily N-acetyltransferase